MKVMFKDKLKKEADNYEIKLTSNDILKKFHEETNTRRSFNYKPLLAFGLSIAILITGGVILLNENEKNISNKYVNILSLEVASSLDLIDSYNTVNLNMLKRKNDDSIDDSSFQDICKNFKDNYHVLKSSIEYKNDKSYEVYEGNYEINDSKYTYKVSLDNDKFLYFSINTKSNDNITKEKYIGVLESNDNYYPLEGVRKLNSNSKEDEIDISITLSKSTIITIEQETERSESSYSYSIIENKKEIYELEIDFERDEIEMECSDLDKEYEYEINEKNGYYSIYYSYENKDIEVDGSMTLTIENNKFIFEDEKNSIYFEINQ